MGPLGMQEIIVIFVIALLLFGPKKLPELGRLLGKGLSEFRRAKNELKTTFETHLREIERETQTQAQPTTTNSDYSPEHASYRYDEYGRYGADQPEQLRTPVAESVPRSNGARPDESQHRV